MSEMDPCEWCEQVLQPYLDRELDEADEAKVKHHLAACGWCEKRYKFEEDLRILVRRAGGTETIDIQPINPYQSELEDFAAAVSGERPHPFGREDAVGQARAIAALYAAAESGADVAP